MSSLPQPLVAYPQAISQPSSNSKGSFGPVFIVLAVIAVLATIACIVGRLCARRLCQQKDPMAFAHSKGDIEDRFGPTIPTAKATRGTKKEDARPTGDGKFRGPDATKKHLEIKGTRGDAKLSGANDGH